MEIKDLAGFGKPLTKLIDVIAKGTGNVFKSNFLKKNTDAKVYEIKKISEAIKESGGGIKQISYDGENVSIVSLDGESIKNEIPIQKRTTNRIEYQSMKKQLNLESITQIAAEQLQNEKEVANEPVDEDWTTRFFNYAEDISNEEMQNLWGRILAGEVKRPGTYSLRTLELLRNLTKNDAQTFTQAANFVISSHQSPFILKSDEAKLGTYGFNFEQKLLLLELGILQPQEMITRNLYPMDKDVDILFEYGHYLIKATKKANTPEVNIPILRFSKTGEELLRLLVPKVNIDYLNDFMNFLQKQNLEIEYGFILSKNGTEINVTQPWLKYDGDIK